MKLNIAYLENEIILKEDKVFSIEIENKKYFYRLVTDLFKAANGILVEDIKIFDKTLIEKIGGNKWDIIVDYFNFEHNLKKYNNAILKYVISYINDKEKDEIIRISHRLINYYNKLLNNMDLPLSINFDTNIDSITKILKINLNENQNILENIFLLIDLERELKLNDILFFVNLKQFLTKEELEEIFKYTLYNHVNIILIDSQCYGTTNRYESKLIIDSSLEEFMLQ